MLHCLVICISCISDEKRVLKIVLWENPGRWRAGAEALGHFGVSSGAGSMADWLDLALAELTSATQSEHGGVSAICALVKPRTT